MLAYYGRERKLFTLPEAVRKMTSMPADQIGLADRGRIAVGNRMLLIGVGGGFAWGSVYLTW